MPNKTDQTKTSLDSMKTIMTAWQHQRSNDDQIAFIDLELSWVSSDSVADSLESSRRALFAERSQLNLPKYPRNSLKTQEL